MVTSHLYRKLTDTSFMDVRLRLFEYSANCSLERLLQKTLDEIEVLTQSSIGFYHFVDSNQTSLILQAWSTRTEKEFCKAEGKGMHYSIDRAGVWVDCVRQGKPVIHNDYLSLPDKKGLPEGHAKVIRELVVPVIKDNMIVAILGVGNKPTDYTQTDIEVVSFIADVAWEIVERKRMEEALKKINDDLEKKVKERTAELEWKNRELREFTSIASHDLQEPLRKIKLFGDLVQQELSGVLTDKAHDYLERMNKAAGRMQRLIKSVLSYSHTSPRKTPFERVDLRSIVEVIANDLLPEEEGLTPVFEITDLPVIDADPVQMHQLFQNLLANAVHYHKKNQAPMIKVSSRIPESDDRQNNCTCELIVEDNGIGFDMTYADRIFLPFERLHARNKFKGTGMGLAICRKITELHRGKIVAYSTPGEGSTFIVTLPMRQTDEPE